MTLQWLNMGIDIELCENEVVVIVIEHPECYTEFIDDLQKSAENIQESILLYDDNKKLKFNKCSEVVFSPLLLDFNSKKIQQHLYDELKGLSDETFFEIKEQINTCIVSYLDELSVKLQYPISFALTLDEKSLYKQYDVHIEYENELLIERMINYIQIMSLLCEIKILFLINVKPYFTDAQLNEIYQSAFLNKIQIVMLESNRGRQLLSAEKCLILDGDKCLIQL